MATDVKKGILAICPIFVFLAVYLVSAIACGDFYSIPVSAAFLIAAIFAICTSEGVLKDRIDCFSKGASDKGILLMIWIFILAGAFSQTAKDIGAVDATVKLALEIIPGKLVFAGLFLTACFISMAIGTSVGTIVALAPIASGMAVQTGESVPFMTAIIVGGAFFGDNLSFISDTTIAATQALGCRMKDKFKANLKIVLPAVIFVLVLYVFKGASAEFIKTEAQIPWIKVMPYILIIVLALCGVNVTLTLSLGILSNMLIGLAGGILSWAGFLSSIGTGIIGMAELIIVTLLAGGMLECIRQNGGMDFISRGLTWKTSGRRGAYLSIAALVSTANFCTANNTIAIITTGAMAKDIAEKFSLDKKKVASILDTCSCVVQGIIPYGAQLLMASQLTGVPGVEIIQYLYYPMALSVCVIGAILFRKA